MGCLAAIVVVLLIVWLANSPSTFFIGAIIFVGLITWGCIYTSNKKKEEDKKQKEINKKNNEIFDNKKKEYNIPEECLKMNYKRGYASINAGTMDTWKEDNNLCFFSAIALNDEDQYQLYKIPLKDIEYFYSQGEIFRETRIFGGGGQTGGSSIGGAIAGGVIAGGAGAVIGSRKKGKIEPIKSELITHDERETYINYFVDNVKHSIFFDFKDYYVLQVLIPGKEYSSTVQTNINPTINIAKQIKDLAELRDSGILTEDEFNDKKKILLDKI